MDASQGVFKLIGTVQHYAWGGYNFIPQLLGRSNPDHRPFAEYWLGAHPSRSSTTEDQFPLSDIINGHPDRYLGSNTSKRFSSLPFLFKVLDVRQMLSIQVHPSIEGARNGFAEEEQRGIAVTASNRNYKDLNHKPEIMVALTDFWLLHGFKVTSHLTQTLDAVPEFRFLKKVFDTKSYRGLYEEVMLMEQPRVNEILAPLAARILPAYKENKLTKDRADFWAAKAVDSFYHDGNFDRGIFSIYFFNLLSIKKGSGIYQPAGLPHAYLEGQNIELMANSDNVLRAGLTDKHIDVPELMKHIVFEPTEPRILHGKATGSKRIFSGDVEEFELIQYQTARGGEEKFTSEGPANALLVEGEARLHANGKELPLKQGESVFVAAGTKLDIKARTSLNLFIATVPAR